MYLSVAQTGDLHWNEMSSCLPNLLLIQFREGATVIAICHKNFPLFQMELKITRIIPFVLPFPSQILIIQVTHGNLTIAITRYMFTTRVCGYLMFWGMYVFMCVCISVCPSVRPSICPSNFMNLIVLRKRVVCLPLKCIIVGQRCDLWHMYFSHWALWYTVVKNWNKSLN